MKIVRTGLFFLILLSAQVLGDAPTCGAQAPEELLTPAEVAALTNRLLQIHAEFTQMKPPGWSIQTKEVGRIKKDGRLTVRYQVYVQGVPEGTIFRAANWPVTQEHPSVITEGVTVGADGLMLCAGRNRRQCGSPDKPDDPVEFTFHPLKGEAVRLAFISPAGTVGMAVAPEPIEAADKSCSLSVQRLTARFELAYFTGTGFPPNADVHYKITFGTTSDQVIRTDAQGIFRAAIAVQRKPEEDRGRVQIRITEKKCSPQLSYDWGKL